MKRRIRSSRNLTTQNIKKNKHGKKTPLRINKKLVSIVAAVLLLSIIIGVVYLWYQKRYSGFVAVYNNYQPAFAPGDVSAERVSLSEGRSFNILLLGLDQRESGHIKADAVFIVHYDSGSKRFQTFELPSKAKYYWPLKNEYVELANAYALGQLHSPASGYSIIQDIVESNLAIRIDAYVASDIIGFAHLIDNSGNLTVRNGETFTDKDLATFGLRDNFKVGTINLSTNDVTAFVRADENGFNAKSLRHYSVMRSLMQSLNISDLHASLGSFDDIDNHVYSNLHGDSIRHFIRLFANEKIFTFDFYQAGAILSKTSDVVGDVFDPVKFDDFISSTFVNSEIIREQARIEIYNSTDIPGLASRYARILQNMGCDVIRKSNTGGGFSETIIFTEYPESFPLTIDQIKGVLGVDIELISDTPGFVTTGDLIIVLADDVEGI